MNLKNVFACALLIGAMCVMSSCSKDDNDGEGTSQSEVKNNALKAANKLFVETTVQQTYRGLADKTADMIDALKAFEKSANQSDLDAAAKSWKESRQYWEWSEAFLFGAATGYGIDPHIDTWPFDAAAFNNYMKKYNPAEDEDDANILAEAIATGQNLTGFHAVEYLLFREGKVRKASDVTADEIWFCVTASEDLLLSSLKLAAAWGCKLSSDETALLEDAEFEYDRFDEEFVSAGEAGSRWKTPLAASVQIIEGCKTIVDEVASGKIGTPYTGEDPNNIESPHAYNSIVDFYDNIQSCKNALYGLAPSVSSKDITVPAEGSLMAYAKTACPNEYAQVKSAIENALTAINGMKVPFVLYYTDSSVGNAIDAVKKLDDALSVLRNALSEND